MSQNRTPDDEDMREFMARLEREFQNRAQPPDESATSPGGQAIQEAVRTPQRVRLSLPLTPPRLVFALLAINVIMFAITNLIAAQSRLPSDVAFEQALRTLGWKENDLINQGQWWRLLTPMVLHASLIHLLFNSWALYALGTEVERVYGTARFAAIYLLAGLAGSIASYAFNPAAPSVGASGAIFGLFGALGVFSYSSRSLIGWEATKMQLGQMLTLVVINLMFGFIPGSNIDNSAHLGGLVAGTIASFGLAPRYTIDRRSYMPSIQRRDPPLAGWAVAAVLLVALVGLFYFVYPV